MQWSDQTTFYFTIQPFCFTIFEYVLSTVHSKHSFDVYIIQPDFPVVKSFYTKNQKNVRLKSRFHVNVCFLLIFQLITAQARLDAIIYSYFSIFFMYCKYM